MSMDLAGWIPIRLNWSESGLKVDWCQLGDLRFTDPFFEQTVGQCLRHPANLLFRRETPVEILGALDDLDASLAPTGFIFHMSRCGSTLISQMLAAQPENVVISEASPIDTLLRAPLRDPGITEDQQAAWLQGLLKALGQRRFSGEKHLFVKFDCWHTLCLPLIQRAFPEVPWIFLYREPLEVLVSQHNQMGGQMIPGMLEPALFGWDAQAVTRMGWPEYGGRVLGRICEVALEQAGAGRGKLVNYCQLPEVVWSELMTYWGVGCVPEAVETMRRVSALNAKNPALPFEADVQVKQGGVTEEIRQVARQWLDETYRQLESRRTGMAA